jgi:hypothetical protein
MLAWRRTAARRRVVVNLRTGTTIRGVLWTQRGAVLVVKDADLLADTGTTLPAPARLDGEVILERSNVDFVQVLPEPRAG